MTANSRLERYKNLQDGDGVTVSGEVVTGEPTAWRSFVYLSGQYYISNWYKRRYEVTYYERLQDARLYDCQIEEKKLIREVTDLYGALAEARTRLNYSFLIMGKLKQVLDLKKQAFAQGQIAYEDVIRAEADIANEDRQISELLKEFQENLKRLQSYTGRQYLEGIDVVRFPSPQEKSFPESAQVIEDTPEYKSRLTELEAVQFKKKAAANNFWPDISLYGRYDFFGTDAEHPDNSYRHLRSADYVAGLLISLPIFDGGTRKWERQRNLSEVRRHQESVKAAVEEKEWDLKALNAGYQELQRTVRHYNNLSGQYEKMLAITRKAYVLGERSLIDIAVMEKDALSVERDLRVAELTVSTYEQRLVLETGYENMMSEFHGNRTCKY